MAREGVRCARGAATTRPAARPAAAKPEARDAAIQRALDSPFDLPRCRCARSPTSSAKPQPGKARCCVTVEADIRGLAFEEQGGTAKDTLELCCSWSHARPASSTASTSSSRCAPAGDAGPLRAQLVPDRARAAARARPLPGEDRGARPQQRAPRQPDPRLRGAGARRPAPLEPDSQRPLARGAPDGRVPEPIARRTFAPAGVLHCRFEVYGAATRPSGQPNVTAGFSIRRSDGRFLAAAPETPLRPGPTAPWRAASARRSRARPPGRYEMIVSVTDLAAGRVAEAREPFGIEAPCRALTQPQGRPRSRKRARDRRAGPGRAQRLAERRRAPRRSPSSRRVRARPFKRHRRARPGGERPLEDTAWPRRGGRSKPARPPGTAAPRRSSARARPPAEEGDRLVRAPAPHPHDAELGQRAASAGSSSRIRA